MNGIYYNGFDYSNDRFRDDIDRSTSLYDYFRTEYNDVVDRSSFDETISYYLKSNEKLDRKIVINLLKKLKDLLEKDSECLAISLNSQAYLYFASEYQYALKYNNHIIIPTKDLR